MAAEAEEFRFARDDRSSEHIGEDFRESRSNSSRGASPLALPAACSSRSAPEVPRD